MTKRNEMERETEGAGEVRTAAESARRRPRSRWVSEAIGAALSDEPPRPQTRVVSEAVVAALPAEAEAAPGVGADDEAGAGA